MAGEPRDPMAAEDPRRKGNVRLALTLAAIAALFFVAFIFRGAMSLR